MNNLELRALRVGLGISQVTMAEAVGVTRAQYMRYEAGQRKRPDGTVAPTRVPGPVAKLAELVREGWQQWLAEQDEASDALREAEDTVEELQRARQAVLEEVEG